MTKERRSFRCEPAPRRREALVKATLDLIAETGLRGATVRAIAQRAHVTQGLIRHHFRTKEELILAAYDHHMTGLTEASFAAVETDPDAPVLIRLGRVVTASLSAPVANADSVTLWAGFITQLRYDPAMRGIHVRTYRDFRDRLERLVTEALTEDDRPPDPAEARRLAIACNGVIDGLWLEQSVLSEDLDVADLAGIGLRAVGAILGLDLPEVPVSEEAAQGASHERTAAP